MICFLIMFQKLFFLQIYFSGDLAHPVGHMITLSFLLTHINIIEDYYWRLLGNSTANVQMSRFNIL